LSERSIDPVFNERKAGKLESRNSGDLKKPNYGCENLLEEKFYLRVRAEISSHFLVLKHPLGKARKRWNIRHIPSFRNAAMRDASTSKVIRDASALKM